MIYQVFCFCIISMANSATMATLRIHYLGTSSPYTDQTSCNEEEMVGLQGVRIVNGKVHEKDRDADIRRPRVSSSCLVAMRKGVLVVPGYSSGEPIHNFQVSSDPFLYIYSV